VGAPKSPILADASGIVASTHKFPSDWLGFPISRSGAAERS